MAFDII